MEGLTFGDMMSDEEVMGLFGGDIQTPEEEKTPKGDKEEPKNGDEIEEKQNTAEDLNPDEIFGGSPESVGSEENNKETEEPASDEGGSSPNFFSSMATAFAEEGLFPDLDEETISKIENAEDFGKAMKEQMEAQLTEVQKRVQEVLEHGGNDEQKAQTAEYEQVLSVLEKFESQIDKEGDQGDEVRKRIIYQDCINRGYSEAKAQKEVERSFDRGTEMEDAKEALESNKEFYTKEYKKFRDSIKAKADKEVEEREKKAAKIKDTIMNDNLKFFDGLEIDKKTRQAAFDAISKPVYKDPKTGTLYTALQKMQMDNDGEYQAIVGLCYALTNGFTSIEGLVGKKAKKEVKKGFAQLESTFANSSRDAKGNLKFTSGVSDSESYLGKGVKLDI